MCPALVVFAPTRSQRACCSPIMNAMGDLLLEYTLYRGIGLGSILMLATRFVNISCAVVHSLCTSYPVYGLPVTYLTFFGVSLSPCVMSVPGIRAALATTACGVCSHSAHAEWRSKVQNKGEERTQNTYGYTGANRSLKHVAVDATN